MPSNNPSQIKVLFFHIMKENFSGAQKNLYRLLINLDKTRLNPILVGQMDSPLTELVRKDGMDVVLVPFPSSLEVFDRKLLTFNIKQLFGFFIGLVDYNKTMGKIFDQENPDVIWCDNIRTFITLYPICLLKRKRIIWNIWSEPAGIVAWLLHRLGLFLANCVNLEYISQKETVFGNMHKINFLNKKIVALYTGVSDFEPLIGSNIRKELSLSGEDIIFIMASNIAYGKRQMDLIQAIESISFANTTVHLLIAGSPVQSNPESVEYYDLIYSYAVSKKLLDKVHFLGWRSDLRDVLKYANVYLSSSASESLPDAVRDAMLASLPIVATNVGGTSELVTDGVNGYLYPSGDLKSLIAYMERLIEDPSLRKRMGIESNKIIKNRFSTKAYARNFEKMIEDVFHNNYAFK
jgi:glycosyltransferase involved in cell wall biosynthesis